MSVLPNKGRKSALPGQERRLSQDPILQSRFSSSQRKPFLGVIICGTGFSRGTTCLGAESLFCQSQNLQHFQHFNLMVCR